MQHGAQRFEAVQDADAALDIVHEDPEFLVVNKPAGMPSHPLEEAETGTLVNALLARYPELSGVGYQRFDGQAYREAGLVHRLDNQTSGLMLVARNQESFSKLRAVLESGAIKKTYRLVCEGVLTQPRTIDLPIAPHPKNKRKVKVCVGPALAQKLGAKQAHTEIRNVHIIECVTELEALAPFARRHQLRAHLGAIGHPLLGDTLYQGLRMPGLARFFLHAESMSFPHPTTEAPQHFVAPLPLELKQTLHGLEHRRRFVRMQLRDRGIRAPRVLAAMQLMPREEFLDATQRGHAYDDSALTIGLGQTISQPYMVARMCELAELKSTERVLEVGAGSGYQAAILATLARKVVSIERIEDLANRANAAVRRVGMYNVEVVHADGTVGHSASAPYDAVLVAAGAPTLPIRLAEQLAPGGRLVIPIGTSEEQRLCVIRRRNRNDYTSPEFEEQWFDRCMFVPLLGQQGWR